MLVGLGILGGLLGCVGGLLGCFGWPSWVPWGGSGCLLGDLGLHLGLAIREEGHEASILETSEKPCKKHSFGAVSGVFVLDLGAAGAS